jgi:formate hydrogenlyase subunit 6/NADH:ubiquinone oxidoreductase subunit I
MLREVERLQMHYRTSMSIMYTAISAEAFVIMHVLQRMSSCMCCSVCHHACVVAYFIMHVL